MVNGILGKKIGMTQLFLDDGDCIPVTVIEAGPCVVTQVKSREKDNYTAVQLGFGDKRKKNVRRPQLKSFEKNKIDPKRHLKEFRCGDVSDVKVGQTIEADLFEEGDYLNITGTSKGRGFTGVIKRHGFHGAPATRGAHESYRGGGSIGMCVNPGRVHKGKKMAGQHGNAGNTVLNLEVVRVEKKKNLVLIKGAAPGANGGLLILKKSQRKSKK